MCLIVVDRGFILTSVTTSDNNVDVDTALKSLLAGFVDGVIEEVDPLGVFNGDSISSLFFAKWYLW